MALLSLSLFSLGVSAHSHSHNHGHGAHWRRAADAAAAATCPTVAPPAGFSALTSSFPPAGQIATIVSGDTVAQNLYNTILNTAAFQTALAFVPQGSNLGDFSNVTYDGATDPHCWWSYTICHTPKQPYLVEDTWYCPEPNTWGLSFDDGPYCDHNSFYDFLNQNKLKATLFYIGTNMINNPSQAQRGITDGHEICVHTWEHRYMTTLTNEQVFAELYYTKKLIKDLLGVTATCWRPPFGDVDDRVRTWAYALGMRTVIWNHDTFDWSEGTNGVTATTVQNNYAQVLGNVSNSGGEIVLTHELNPNTMNMFMSEYPKIAKTYKSIVPVASCMNITKPYLEDITFPNFAQFTSGNINASPAQNPVVSNAPVSIAGIATSAGASGTGKSGSSTGGSTNPGGTKAGSGSRVFVATSAVVAVAFGAMLVVLA